MTDIAYASSRLCHRRPIARPYAQFALCIGIGMILIGLVAVLAVL